MKRVVKQPDSIESGQVSWIKSFGSVAALLGPLIGKGLKSLVDMGVQYEKMQQDKESKNYKAEFYPTARIFTTNQRGCKHLA